MSIFIKFSIIIILILCTAFFVASEYAMVKVRRTRMEELARNGNHRAKRVIFLLQHLDDILSACQLGITICSLGLGWLAQPTVATILKPLINQINISTTTSQTLTYIIAFLLVTYVNVVVGELLPKTIAIQQTDTIALTLSRPIYIFEKICYPVIWVLQKTANFFIKLLGFQPASESDEVHSEDELRSIMANALKQGEINKVEYSYANRVFEFDNRVAKEIMVPRNEVEVLDLKDDLTTILNQIEQEKYTRYPIIEGNKDKLLGMLNIKKIFIRDHMIETLEELKEYISPIETIFELMPISKVLNKMQNEHIHMVALVDEFGGISGIITMEDIIEEIIGEIRDEFDSEERLPVTKVDQHTYILKGSIAIQDVNQYFSLNLPHQQVDTLSGWLHLQDFYVSENDEYTVDHVTFKVLKKSNYRVTKVEVKINPKEVNKEGI